MSKEKQIFEDLAEEILEEFAGSYSQADKERLAITICKKSKTGVAREIFEEIEKVIGNKYEYYVFDNMDIEGIEQDAIIAFADAMKKHFAELKKKYVDSVNVDKK